MRVLLFLTLLFPTFGQANIRLYPGYVTKVRCEGRLHISAVGNDQIVQLDALPREVACGVLLKPTVKSGTTNLILETSTGTVREIVEIAEGRPTGSEKLLFVVKGANE